MAVVLVMAREYSTQCPLTAVYSGIFQLFGTATCGVTLVGVHPYLSLRVGGIGDATHL